MTRDKLIKKNCDMDNDGDNAFGLFAGYNLRCDV